MQIKANFITESVELGSDHPEDNRDTPKIRTEPGATALEFIYSNEESRLKSSLRSEWNGLSLWLVLRFRDLVKL